MINLRIGRIGQVFAPGYGWCLRCKTPWLFVSWHDTQYGADGNGCLPLCEKCWGELTPAQRLPFYRQLIESWHERPGRGLTLDEEWPLVESAVMSDH
jgi:hypothetical protein